jgi:glycosyltransferase involved in cell wall biosynthesis
MNVRKIAFLTQAAPWTGNELFGAYNISQAKAFRALGVETEIFSPMMFIPPLLDRVHGGFRRLRSRPAEYQFEGIPIHVVRGPYPHPVFLRWKVTPRAPRLAAAWVKRAVMGRMERRLRAFAPDVLLVHDGLILGRLAAELSRRLHVPWAVIEHDPIDLAPDSKAGRFYATTMREAGHVFTVHRPTESYLHEKLALPQAKLVLNGTLKPTEQQWATPRPAQWVGKKIILSVGSYIQRKARPELVRAFAEGAGDDAILVLLGPGEPPAELLRLIDELGVRERVDIVGGKTPQEVQQYMVWADRFALPSWWEAFGLVYLEAMAAATPIILSSDSGMAAEIESGVHGWIVPPRDHAALVAALREALMNADLEAMGERGRARVEERFSWEKNARMILDALQSIDCKTARK